MTEKSVSGLGIMNIITIASNNRLSDGNIRIEYRLSSPVTLDVLDALSHGKWVCSGRQYLSPTFLITKPDGIEIQGILQSPFITVVCSPGLQAGFEDYLNEFLSTIPDSEASESFYHRFIENIRMTYWIFKIRNS